MRQREELRRTIAAAGKLLEWQTQGPDAMDQACDDTLRLARNGMRALDRDLGAEIDAKKAETTELRKALKALAREAKSHDFEEPLVFTYTHTARTPPKGLGTKTEMKELAGLEEVDKAVEELGGKSETWDKLREEMLGQLKARRERLGEARRQLPTFVESSHSLLRHALVTML